MKLFLSTAASLSTTACLSSAAKVFVFALLAAGCFHEPYQEEGWATKPITSEYYFPARAPDGQPAEDFWTKRDLNMGRMSYMHYCYACHGVNGDGRGPAAIGYRPPPRDFRNANFKFGAVRSGEKPSDDDLVRIISGGLHGTAMLEWDIPEVQLRRIIAFIKTFPQAPCDPKVSGKEICDKEAIDFPNGKPSKWQERYTSGKKEGQFKPLGEPIEVPAKDPWVGRSDEAREKGAELYHLKAQCANCHPSYLPRATLSAMNEKLEGKPLTAFRDGMYLSIVLAAKDNPYRVNLMPTDFTLNPMRSIRKGHEMPDLWRLIAAGVGGVMPAWIDGLKPDDIWALAHYVKSLADLARAENRGKLNELRQQLANQPPFQPPPPAAPPEKSITLEIAADGSVKLGDEAFEDDEKLQDKLSALLAAGPLALKIEADENTKPERIIALALLVKEAGVVKLTLPDGIELPEEEDEAADEPVEAPEPPPAVPDKPAVPISGDGDVLDKKGTTKVPPTPTPKVQPPSVPKPPGGKPPAGKPPAPPKPAKPAPPPSDPYDI